MSAVYTHHSYQPFAALRRTLQFVRRHALNALLIYLSILIFTKKDINVHFQLADGGLLKGGQQMLRHSGANLGAETIRFGSPLPPVTEEKEEEPAFSIGNLTPVLSPDYAKRKNIPRSVVRSKMKIVKSYLKEYAPLARDEMETYGIPASITLAQGLLESNAGDSRLARESNNHFGIKCRSKCLGCTCRNYSDDDRYDMFRVFNAARESYREHSLLLSGGRYKHLLALDTSDYQGWAHGLKKAGYATDSHYAEKLIQIIKELRLYKYDQ